MLRMQQFYRGVGSVNESNDPEKSLREIGMIARCLDSISNVEFQQFNLSRGQYLYLYRICENPGIIPNQLAELLKVDRTTAYQSNQQTGIRRLYCKTVRIG